VGALLELASAPEALRAAWERVLRDDGHDDVLSPGVQRFQTDAGEQLAEIAEHLGAGAYRPGVLTEIAIPKNDGGQRLLHIPTVRDRIVERSLLSVLTPVLDPLLGPSSFAYRPGMGVADAVRAVVSLRDEGLRWVLRTDVHDCFPSVDIARLLRLICTAIDDRELVDLLPTRSSIFVLCPVDLCAE
jgi:CRISPR-associated protein Cas1